METIYLIIVFIVPGMMHKEIKHALRIEPKKKMEGTQYEQLFYVVINSIVITAASLVAMKLFRLIETLPKNLDEIIINIKDFAFLGRYAATMVVITLLWYIISEVVLKKIWHKLKNWYFQKRFNSYFASERPRTVWEETVASVILSQKEKNRKPLIAIYDGKELITAGFLDMFNQGEFSNIGINLTRTRKVMRLLDADDKKADSDKLFGKILQEYYDVKSGKRIVFFDNKKIYEHWGD